MPPPVSTTPPPGSLASVIRPSEAITTSAPCRLVTPSGRINAEVAVLNHKAGAVPGGAVLVLAPATSKLPIRILYALPITTQFTSALMQIPPSPSQSYFAQSSKPHIELMLTTSPVNGRKALLQFPAGDSARVNALMKEVRKAVAASIPSPFSHAWLALYPEVEGEVVPSPTTQETMKAKLDDSLEASFGKLDTSDDDDGKDVQATPTGLGKPAKLAEEQEPRAPAADDSLESIDIDEVDKPDEVKPHVETVNDESEATDETKDDTAEETAADDAEAEVEEPKVNGSSTPTATTPSQTKQVADDDQSDDDEQFPNPYVPGFSRTGFLRNRLFQRQQKWSSTKPVSIRVVTYNVNDRTPPAGTKELGPIVGYGAEDIIVIGLQEVDLRGQALFVSQGTSRADAWEEAVYAGLGDRKTDFEKVASVQYVGVLLIIFVKSELRPEVRMVQETSKAIGLLGFGGNKAGVAARLKVHDTTIAFVNSHLAAFANQLERRRLDYQALLGGLNFPNPTTRQPATEAFYSEDGSPLGLSDSDVLFWFGDLNYRIDLEDTEVRSLCETGSYDTLLTADQLLSDMAENLSFGGFSEPRISFKPSFKYVHGSTTLDPKRAPAYTDRVLYCSHGIKVAPNKYNSHELLWSDHLPVTSTFLVDTRVVDESKRSEELVTIQCELDKLDELYRPSLMVEADEVDFGLVKYRTEVKRKFTLRNTGLVDATFSFRVPSPGKPICKPWFWPFPCSGVVGSGQQVELTMTAFVNEDDSGALTGGDDMLDVLVLQIDGGTDSFLSLRAQFQPTIVGFPLQLIPALPGPIRDLPLAERKALYHPPPSDDADSSKGTPNGKSTTKPPREVWRLLEQLMAEGTGVEKLWTSEMDLPAVLETIEVLDTGGEKLPGDAKVAAQTLLYLLGALPTPLVPPELGPSCVNIRERDDAFGVLEKVPSVHANVLIGTTSVMRLCCGPDATPDDDMVKALATAVFAGPPAGREGLVKVLLEG